MVNLQIMRKDLEEIKVITSHTKKLQYDSYIKAWGKRIIEKRKECANSRKQAEQEAQVLANILCTRYSASNVYGFHLEQEQIKVMVREFPRILSWLRREIAAFQEYLDKLSQ